MSTLGDIADIATKLGGQQGKEGGLASLQQVMNSAGGVQGITQKLSSSGLGQQVQSWISSQQNQQVSGQQIKDHVDPTHVQTMADQSGMSHEEVHDHVAQALPHMVDKATPEGQVPAPQNDPFAKGVEVIKQLLKA